MIYVRDDDVLIRSSSWDSPFKRFKQIHKWICEVPDKVLHIPTILVTEIQEFPETIEYIKEETKEGRMKPEIHGLKHIDYGKLSGEEIQDHLKQCQDYMLKTFNVVPTRFYTPWGASADFITEAAAAVDLSVVDCSNINKLEGRYGVVRRLMDGHDPFKILEENEIFMHWWGGGLRLKRVMEAIKYGNWKLAVEANKGNGLFDAA